MLLGDVINFLIALLEEISMRVVYHEAYDFMCLSLLILSAPQLSVLLSINIHKHFRKKNSIQ